MAIKYMIGVDLGTTSTKVVLFDLKGHAIATANNPYPLYQDTPTWLRKIRKRFLQRQLAV